MTKLYLVQKEISKKPVNSGFEKEKDQWADFYNKSKAFNSVQKEIARIKNQKNYNPLKFIKLSILQLSSSFFNFIPVSDKASVTAQKAILSTLNSIRNDGLMPPKSNLKL